MSVYVFFKLPTFALARKFGAAFFCLFATPSAPTPSLSYTHTRCLIPSARQTLACAAPVNIFAASAAAADDDDAPPPPALRQKAQKPTHPSTALDKCTRKHDDFTSTQGTTQAKTAAKLEPCVKERAARTRAQAHAKQQHTRRSALCLNAHAQSRPVPRSILELANTARAGAA